MVTVIEVFIAIVSAYVFIEFFKDDILRIKQKFNYWRNKRKALRKIARKAKR